MTKLNQALANISLNIASPGQTDMNLRQRPQMAAGMFMNLPVSEIDYFELNPRRRHSDEVYQHIKESIRASGIQQPVHVTQRPNNERYILAQGGNTRLKIMRELWQETQDERFRLMPCFYVAYTCDRDLRIAHLIENEQRAEMCFWDKACAYAVMRDEFCQEKDQDLSLRELETLFGQHGLSISHVTLGQYFFAHDYLSGLSELAFSLSNAKVSELKKIYGSVNNAAQIQKIDSGTVDTLWIQSVEQWVATTPTNLDTSKLLQHIETTFQSESWFTDSTEPHTEPNLNNLETDAGLSDDIKTDPDDCHNLEADAADLTSTTDETFIQPSGAEREVVDPPHGSGHALPTSSQQAAVKPINTEQCQQLLHSCIRRWLHRVGLADCFKKHAAFDYGFYLEYPPFEHISPKEDRPFLIDALNDQAGNVFAYLSKVSGQERFINDTESGQRNPLLQLPQDSKLRIAYEEPDKWDEYNDLGIGERPNLITELLMWQTTSSHPFYEDMNRLIDLLTQVNQAAQQEVKS